MHRILVVAATALTALMLVACSPGINLLGHRITFDSSGMVVHAAGQPNAHVSRDGNLSIDGKAVAVTPAQRQLLQHYYQQAHAVMDSGEGMGRQGIQMAKSSIEQAVASIFSKDSPAADKRMNAQSQKIEASADAFCGEVRALGIIEATVAADLPAFKPYTNGEEMQCRITHTVVVRHADGTTTKTETSSFAVSSGSDAGAKATAATHAQTAPTSATSHQP